MVRLRVRVSRASVRVCLTLCSLWYTSSLKSSSTYGETTLIFKKSGAFQGLQYTEQGEQMAANGLQIETSGIL